MASQRVGSTAILGGSTTRQAPRRAPAARVGNRPTAPVKAVHHRAWRGIIPGGLAQPGGGDPSTHQPVCSPAPFSSR